MILPGCHSDSMLCAKFLCISLAFIQPVPQLYISERIKHPLCHLDSPSADPCMHSI